MDFRLNIILLFYLEAGEKLLNHYYEHLIQLNNQPYLNLK